MERLKTPYRGIMQAIGLNEIELAKNIIEQTMAEQDDTSMLRMLLDSTQTVRDHPQIAPVRRKLIDTIESRIGKIH